MPTKDRAAEDLYKELNVGQLVKAYQQAMLALTTATGQLEKYPNTPHTWENARTATNCAEAVNRIGEELRAWHCLIWQVE